MITAVSIHAIERMNQRFGTKNILKHIRKRRFLPANGVTLVKGVDYVTKEGCLVTCYYHYKNHKIYDRKKKIGRMLRRMEVIDNFPVEIAMLVRVLKEEK